MPIVDASEYIPKGRYQGGHYNTIITSVVLKSPEVGYERERINTHDGDFLDLDCLRNGNRRAIILCHGLEGSSDSQYMRLFADHYSSRAWDVIAMNYRGCSGEPNLAYRMYNSGTTDDINAVAQHISKDYDQIVIIGFSLGGNLTLKYLGERLYDLPDNLVTGVAISAPVHLSNASQQLLKWDNILYQLKFIQSLAGKVRMKKKQYPDKLSLWPLWRCYNLYQFDDLYTAPMYDYQDAEDYYAHNASIQFIPSLERPALLLNAEDDPFLGELCYPAHLSSDLFHYCQPKYGGHCGFSTSKTERSWLPSKVESFINDQL